MKLAATTATPYSKIPPPFNTRGSSNFRIDAVTAKVLPNHNRDDNSSSGSDSDDSTSAAAGATRRAQLQRLGSIAVSPQQNSKGGSHHHPSHAIGLADDGAQHSIVATGESLSHTLGLTFTKCPFLRPKIMAPGVKCAPTPAANGSLCGFFDAGKLVLFGGSEGIRAMNETWVYTIADRKWKNVDPMEVASDALTAQRRAHGFTEERLPAPRCGHASVNIRDVPDATRLDPHTLRMKPSVPSTTSTAATSTGTKLTKNPTGIATNLPSNGSTSDLWSYLPQMLMFGGADLSKGLYFNDLWVFNVALMAWQELKPGGTPPCERWHHSAAIVEQRLFIYGGESSEFRILDDLHMYDHTIGSWRAIRATQPNPPGRMLHAVTVVGDEMVVIGGVGSQAPNVALLDIAVDHGVHVAGGGGSSQEKRRASYRRPSVQPAGSPTDERSPSLQPGQETTLGTSRVTMTRNATKFKAELSDVWVLNLRTLVWREVAASQKLFSPFVKREDMLLRGPMIAVNGSATGPTLPQPYGYPHAALEIKSLEGHRVVACNERVIVLGGKVGGKLNRRIFSLHLPTETWAYLGELPANQNTESLEIPLARTGAMACGMVEYKTLAAMKDAVSLKDLDQSHRHLNEPNESDPFITALVRQLSSQLSFTGTLGVYHTKPIVSRTICVYLYGGIGVTGKYFSDTWSLELTDTTADTTYDSMHGASMDLLRLGLQQRPDVGGDASSVAITEDEEGVLHNPEVDAQRSTYVLGATGRISVDLLGGTTRTSTAAAHMLSSYGSAGLASGGFGRRSNEVTAMPDGRSSKASVGGLLGGTSISAGGNVAVGRKGSRVSATDLGAGTPTPLLETVDTAATDASSPTHHGRRSINTAANNVGGQRGSK